MNEKWLALTPEDVENLTDEARREAGHCDFSVHDHVSTSTVYELCRNLDHWCGDAIKFSKWRPISEAPRDGTILLLHGGNGAFVKTAVGHYGEHFRNWCWEGKWLKSTDIQPSHFLPIPPTNKLNDEN